MEGWWVEVQQFFDWVLAHWGFCAAVLAIFIQITPAIKWNPLTALGTWIGNVLNGDMRKDIAEMKRAIDENEKDRIRWEVLDFANTCRNGLRHTKDEFQHIIDLNDKYHRLLEKTDDSNGVFTEEYDYILRIYHERQQKNDFL